jgi:hypothetical protein
LMACLALRPAVPLLLASMTLLERVHRRYQKWDRSFFGLAQFW